MRFTTFRALAVALWLAGLLFASVQAQAGQRTVRIGFQKSSTLIMVLKAQGKLEQALAKTGVKVEWAEFMAGPPLLEALNVGAIDMTADVADTVPLFAQAAGAKLVYLAQEAPSPTAQGILVPEGSPLKVPADLKGKKVAFTKGTGGHYLLIAALSREGLLLSDITPVYLSPADGRAAFERGSVDAWVTWDPFLSAGQFQARARILTDGRGIASYQRYYLASAKFAQELPGVCAAIYNQLQQTGHWVKKHPAEAAALLAPIWGLDAKIVEQANFRRSYEVRPVKKDYLGEQQVIADSFFNAGVFPKRIDAASAEIWQPSS
jgi:sulfonate transport system substrate-binding protein